jgi:hypothetical protein
MLGLNFFPLFMHHNTCITDCALYANYDMPSPDMAILPCGLPHSLPDVHSLTTPVNPQVSITLVRKFTIVQKQNIRIHRIQWYWKFKNV